jgi:predicted MFS family arabinose efflux permease
MAEVFFFLREYRSIEKPVLNVIISEFFIQMVNATFMVVLPLYLDRMGYDNEQIALFITFRFLGVFILALPLGRFIRGKKLMSLFYLSGFCVPFFGLCIVVAVVSKIKLLIYAALLLWGASFTFMQIPVSPFILRNSHSQNHTAAISLSYSTWSFGGIISGLLIAGLDLINPVIFNEQFILILFSVMGFGGLFFLFRIKNFREESYEENDVTVEAPRTEWNLIAKALIPTLIIATGAGLTIPFISLFFDEVHGLHKGGFSVLSAIAAVLVAYGALLVPKIKKYIGYKIAIPGTQSLAVISLVALATTQFYNQYSVAVIIAATCYLLRQPLMNMAGPMTTEVVLKYVGPRNREITSALTSAIWSGSWVLSGYMVSIMFAQGYHFVNIFLITSLLYAFGIVMYYLLILDYNIRQEKGLIEDD